MKRFFITMALCMAFVGLAQAQLSQGETYSSKIITGNRPGSGDWGLYIGPSYTEVKDLIDTWNLQGETAYGLPLINLKYYVNDGFELRMGLQYNGHTSKTNGTYTVDYDDIYSYYDEDFGTRNIPLVDNSYSRRFRLCPGFAYHFSPKNILDVYVGAAIPVGTDSEGKVHETANYQVFTNELNGTHSLQKVDVKDNFSYNSFVIGFGGFIGLQAFVADLPFSLGLEYGLTGMLRTGDKCYHVVTDGSGNTQSYYTSCNEVEHFNELNNKSKYMGSDVRLTFTYYFNNK